MKDLYLIKNESSRVAMQTTAETLSSFNKLHYREEPILKTKQRLFFMSYTIYFQKNSCLVEAFNLQIEKLLSNGLISTWVSGFIDTETASYSSQNGGVTKPLNIRQLGGIFIISIILYFVSFLAFILEILSIRINRIRKVIEYFTLVD